MKSLVIHPDDESTDFLKPIYAKLNNKIVINDSKDFEKLKEASVNEGMWTDWFGADQDDDSNNPYADEQHGRGLTGKPIDKMTEREFDDYIEAKYGISNDSTSGGRTMRDLTDDEFNDYWDDRKAFTRREKYKKDDDDTEDLKAWFDKMNPKKYKTGSPISGQTPWSQYPDHKGQYSYKKYVQPKDLSQVVNVNNPFDRFLMMGHGSAWGLFGMGNPGMLINDKTVRLLKPCSQNVYIWCNADQYVKPAGLRGFFTGMFISEVGEAKAMNVKNVTQRMVDESNNGFAKIAGQYINSNVQTLHANVKREYGKIAEHNVVAQYNWDRLYVR